MRNFYCKYHNKFMTANHINKMNKGCWTCKYFIKIGSKKTDKKL